MELELKGHVAVVTGGASGIGLACAQALVREGCRVAVWDRSTAEAELGLVVDVSDFTAVEAALRDGHRTENPFDGFRARFARVGLRYAARFHPWLRTPFMTTAHKLEICQ